MTTTMEMATRMWLPGGEGVAMQQQRRRTSRRWNCGWSKRYGGRQVVDGISMSVGRGEAVGLLGPDGAGKESSVFRRLSVHDNIRLIIGVPRAQRACRVQELIEEFLLQAVGNIMGRALSGASSGGRSLRERWPPIVQEGPKDFVGDEPFAGMDPIGVAGMQKQVRRLCDEEELGVLIRDQGVLITDHNVNETLRICDRACMVQNGCVMASGGPEES